MRGEDVPVDFVGEALGGPRPTNSLDQAADEWPLPLHQVLVLTEQRQGYTSAIRVFNIKRDGSARTAHVLASQRSRADPPDARHTEPDDPVFTINPGGKKTTVAAWSALDKFIVTGHEDGMLKLFDTVRFRGDGTVEQGVEVLIRTARMCRRMARSSGARTRRHTRSRSRTCSSPRTAPTLSPRPRTSRPRCVLGAATLARPRLIIIFNTDLVGRTGQEFVGRRGVPHAHQDVHGRHAAQQRRAHPGQAVRARRRRTGRHERHDHLGTTGPL